MRLKRGHSTFALIVVANMMLTICCCCCGGVGSNGTSNVSTVSEADREFQKAASRKGESQRVAAKMLVGFRRNDDWSWSQLEDEVDFQFGSIRNEFQEWKTNCVSLGDDD